MSFILDSLGNLKISMEFTLMGYTCPGQEFWSRWKDSWIFSKQYWESWVAWLWILMISSSVSYKPTSFTKASFFRVRRTVSLVTGRQACDWSDTTQPTRVKQLGAGFRFKDTLPIPYSGTKSSHWSFHLSDDIKGMMFSNGVQEEDVRWHQQVTWCQECGSHGAKSAKGTAWKLQGLLKKKKKRLYGFTCIQGQHISVMITTFLKTLWKKPIYGFSNISIVGLPLKNTAALLLSGGPVQFWPSTNAPWGLFPRGHGEQQNWQHNW